MCLRQRKQRLELGLVHEREQAEVSTRTLYVVLKTEKPRARTLNVVLEREREGGGERERESGGRS